MAAVDWTEFYGKCWDILVKHAGARNEGRPGHETSKEYFVRALLDEKYPLTEFRFCGTLGFGGKFWRNNGNVFVSYYPEDKTRKREATVKEVNRLLAEIAPAEGVYGPPKAHKRWVGRFR